MWGKKIIKNISEFFDSGSQVTKLINSIYSKFVDKINEVFDKNKLDKYEIPQVLVIGEESSGKSSLLENLIRVPIFPRNTKYCTKAPIELKLRNTQNSELTCMVEYNGIVSENIPKDTISAYIENIFKEIGDDMSEEPIKVTISAPYLYDFSYIDMPGIRQYPENISEKTISLCEKYLQKENILVICVIPATQTRLTSSKALALVQKYNKTQHTVLALTMVDRLQESNIEELLIHRILGRTDELSGMELAGCIGLFNRTHEDSKSLQMHHEAEKKWFNEIIINCLGESPYANVAEKIKHSLGSENFVKRINELFKKYICENWIPNAVKNCNNICSELVKKLDDIGPDPQVIDENDIRNGIIDCVVRNTPPYPKWNVYKVVLDSAIDTKKCSFCNNTEKYCKSVDGGRDNYYCEMCRMWWIKYNLNEEYVDFRGVHMLINNMASYRQYCTYSDNANYINLWIVHNRDYVLRNNTTEGIYDPKADYSHDSIKEHILESHERIGGMILNVLIHIVNSIFNEDIFASYNMIRFTDFNKFLIERFTEIYNEHLNKAFGMFKLLVYQGVYLNREQFYETWPKIVISYLAEEVMRPSRTQFDKLLQSLDIKSLLYENSYYVEKRADLMLRIENIEKGITDIRDIEKIDI